jgi:hypothetical protein
MAYNIWQLKNNRYIHMNKIIEYIGRHKRFVLIIAGIVCLNFVYGFDARFTIINLLWIFISLVKID